MPFFIPPENCAGNKHPNFSYLHFHYLDGNLYTKTLLSMFVMILRRESLRKINLLFVKKAPHLFTVKVRNGRKK